MVKLLPSKQVSSVRFRPPAPAVRVSIVSIFGWDNILRGVDKTAYLAKPRIPLSEVSLLWDVCYYDLPLEGVAEWKGERYWFDTIEADMPDRKEFFLFRLPASELEKLAALQGLRERLVGRGNRHDDRHLENWDAANPSPFGEKDQRHLSAFSRFDEASKKLPQPSFEKSELIGWCHWSETEPLSSL